MGSADKTPFRMTIDKGRMSPASAFDQERLDAYRNGTQIYVTLYQGRNMKLQRKFFAIVGKAVKDCKTPWQNVDEATDALKLALGVSRLGKTVNGQWFNTPGSLTDLDEPEFVEFYENAVALLQKITGVDPETLGKQSADTGDDEDFDPETGEILSGEVSETQPASSTGEVDEERGGSSTDDGLGGASSEPSLPSPPEPPEPPLMGLTGADSDWLKTVARMLWAATNKGGNTDDHLDLLNNQRKGIECPEHISQLARDKAGSVYRRCKDFIMGEIDGKKAIDLICGISGEDPKTMEMK